MKPWGVVLALATQGSLVFADATGGAFLKIYPSVRAQALGGNQALLVGADALGANPAGLALLAAPWEGYASYSNLDQEVAHGHVAAVHRFMNSRRVIGCSLTSLRAEGGPGTDINGLPLGDIVGAQDLALSVGLGGPLTGSWFWGAAGRGIKSTVGGVSSDIAWAGDAGVLWRHHFVSAGVSLNNVGTPVSFGGQGDPLPASLRLDTAWDFGTIVLTAQGHSSLRESQTDWAMGLEYEIGPIALRGAATIFQTGDDSNSGLEESDFMERLFFGLGFRAGPSQWDYALSELEGGQGTWHRLAVTWRWGVPQKKGGVWDGRVKGDLFGTPIERRPIGAPSGRPTLGGSKKKSPMSAPPKPTPAAKSAAPTSTGTSPGMAPQPKADPTSGVTPITKKKEKAKDKKKSPRRRLKIGDSAY